MFRSARMYIHSILMSLGGIYILMSSYSYLYVSSPIPLSLSLSLSLLSRPLGAPIRRAPIQRA